MNNDYIYVLIPILTIVTAQILKVVIETIQYRKLNIIRLLDGSGGMPSSHSAAVASLTTALAIKMGINSPDFAISLVFSIIIAYDSMGIRYEAGKQAKTINQIVNQMQLQDDYKDQYKKLKEKVGHRPIEVLCGILLGISMALILTR